MAGRIRDFDWASTPLGSIEDWPQSLKTTVGMMTAATHAMVLLWGEPGVLIYNDAYARFAGRRHPEVLGMGAREGWPEIADFNDGNIRRGLAGEAWSLKDLELALDRQGTAEPVWLDLDYTPVPDESGRPAGVMVFVTETTDRVLAERRAATERAIEARHAALVELNDRLRDLTDAGEIAHASAEILGRTLGVSRAGYGVMDTTAETITIDRDWNAQGVSSLAGVIHFRDFGSYIEDLSRGEAVVIADAADDPRTRDTADALKGISATALVNIPLIEQGRVVALVFVNNATPRPWSDADVALIREMAERVRTATERARTAAALRESEARLRFLDDLTTAAQSAIDPEQILAIITRMAARHLGVTNCAYADMDPDQDGFTIRGDWAAPGSPSIVGHYSLADFGKLAVQELGAGRPLIINDNLKELAPGEAATFQAIGISATICMPLVKEGRLLALMAIHHKDPHVWTPAELATIREVTTRCWAHIERVRDEGALREEKRALQILNEAGALIAADQELDRVVQRVTDAGVALSGAQFGAFFYNVLDEAGGSYMLYALSGVPAEAFSSFPMPRNTAVFVPTFLGEGIVRSDDITLDPRYGKNAPRRGMPEGHLPVRSYLAVPVKSRTGEVLGGLFFGHEEPGRFGDDAERGLGGLAGQAAIAIDNARLFQSAQSEIDRRALVEAELSALNATLEARVEERTRELESAHEALRQSQKMEAVGQLTGGIAHDFNNLLAGIAGSLELLDRRLSEGRLNGMERYIDAAQGATQRAASLTQRLLAFSRRQTLDPRPTDLNRLIGGMEDLIRRSVGPNVELEVVGAGGLWTTRVDQSQLENALLNLCINGRDAMAPDGGRLTIETANKWLDERHARARDLAPGQYVSLCVTDTGVGMSPDVQAQVFDPFFTTKPLGQGTGLGLSMIHGFVRQSGGQVRIYSELGKGTTMCLYLPRHHGEVEVDHGQAGVPIPDGGHGETVLIIDDEETVRMLVAEVLGDAGYRVIEAPDGPAGLEILRSDVRIDLLISDVGLPGGLNGRQVADAARETRPDLKVLFITGYAENAAVGNGLLAPGMEVLTKPFVMADLALKVHDLIEG